MIHKERFFGALIIIACIVSVGYCADEPKKQEGEKTGMVMAKNKDVVVRAESIKTSAGPTADFRIEVINPSADKNLVLLVRDDIPSFPFYVQLINEEGMNISPMPQKVAAVNPAKRCRYDIILPGTSHVWFVPVPHQVRVDPRKLTNDNNLQTTPKGEYMAEIEVGVSYFAQDKGVESIPKYPDFQILRLTLPRISISVDPNLFNLDIEDIYRKRK